LSGSKKRAETFSNPQKAAGFSEERIKMASKEMQNPLLNIVQSVRSALKTVLWVVPKTTAQKTAGYTADIATSAIAAPANVGRWALDLTKIPSRLLIYLTDTVGEQTLGRISRIMNTINEKVHKVLGTQPSFIQKAAQAA
jgi:hypothetical protein